MYCRQGKMKAKKINFRFHLHAVRKSQADKTSCYAVSLSDGKQSNEEHNESSQRVRPKAEPPVIMPM